MTVLIPVGVGRQRDRTLQPVDDVMSSHPSTEEFYYAPVSLLFLHDVLSGGKRLLFVPFFGTNNRQTSINFFAQRTKMATVTEGFDARLVTDRISTLIQGFNARLANRPFLFFDFRALWRSR